MERKTISYQIVDACLNSDTKTISDLIDKGGNPEKGFVKACETNNLFIVKYLVENNLCRYVQGGLYECIRKYINNAYHNRHIKIINYLITKLNENDKDHCRLGLQFACLANNMKIINQLLKFNRRLCNEYGLLYSCESGNINLIKKFLKLIKLDKKKPYRNIYKKMDYDLSYKYLMRYNNIEAIQLIEPYIPIDLRNTYKFIGACEGNNLNLIKKLIANKNILNSDIIKGFNGACKYGHSDIIKLLLETFPQEIQTDVSLYVGFVFASHADNLFIVESLLTKFPFISNIIYVNEAFDNACKNGNRKMAQLLINHGADYFRMGLHTAVFYNYIEIVELLIDKCKIDNYELFIAGNEDCLIVYLCQNLEMIKLLTNNDKELLNKTLNLIPDIDFSNGKTIAYLFDNGADFDYKINIDECKNSTTFKYLIEKNYKYKFTDAETIKEINKMNKLIKKKLNTKILLKDIHTQLKKYIKY